MLAATRWSSESKHIGALSAYVNLVEDTFARHEDKIVGLIKEHNVKRAFFTGHSLGGGIANVAHLAVRGQLNKAGSPWAELNGKVTWLAYTFAAPQTVVRKYEPENKPQLMAELDDWSYNVVYGCDAVPRFPGMLGYLGAVVEIVVPDFVDNKLVVTPLGTFLLYTSYIGFTLLVSAFVILKKVNRFFVIRTGLGLLGTIVGTIGGTIVVQVKFLKFFLKNNRFVKKPAKTAGEFLKEKGLEEVIRQFTHTGTVLYKESDNQTYIPLKGEAIQEKLNDVKGAATTELRASQDKKTSLLDAHSYYNHFKFETKVVKKTA